MKTRKSGNRASSAALALTFATLSMCAVAPLVNAQEESVRLVEDLIAEITIIRDELGVYDFPPEAELQYGRAPVHAYVKTMEVLSKLNRVQNRLGIPAVEPGGIPFKAIGPDDVRANLELLLDEVVKVKTQLAIAREIDATVLGATPTPELLYKRLGDASFLLDGLLGQPQLPDDVYRNASQVLGYVELIAEGVGVAVESEPPPVEGAKKPVELYRQARVAINKVVDLQKQLGMEASAPPDLTLVRVTPSQVHEAANALLADVALVKFQLGIDDPVPEMAAPSGMRPEEVFGLILLIIDNLDRISSGISEEMRTEIRERQAALIREQRQREAERQRELEAERQRELEEQRQLELERQAEQQRQEEERQREAEQRQREAEQRRQEEEALQREVERLRQEEEARQREAERLREEEEAARLAQLEAEAQVPTCQVLIDPSSDDFIPAYPQRSRRDLGTAVIMVGFEIDESGEIIDEAVAVIHERSSASKEDHFDKFAEAALDTVRDWSPDFEEPDGESCRRDQTGMVTFRFEY